MNLAWFFSLKSVALVEQRNGRFAASSIQGILQGRKVEVEDLPAQHEVGESGGDPAKAAAARADPCNLPPKVGKGRVPAQRRFDLPQINDSMP